ncbi:MAG: rhodanese-like domain-containing protein [Bacteroidetes bacterium]|jgi:rhodanese-related sulfurtransferase|nr:rhodanese-like domain-containing protein [Bacteroidota bacterium]
MAYKTPIFQQYTFEKVLHLSPGEAYEIINSGEAVLLDVREDWEVMEGRPQMGDKVIHIPMSQLARRIDSLPTDKLLIVMCAHGIRSVQVVSYLAEKYQLDVINMDGAFEQWEMQKLPTSKGLY